MQEASPTPNEPDSAKEERLRTLADAGEPAFRARQAWEWTAGGAGGYDEMTDRRDAELLLRLLMAGQLRPVRIPSEAEEAARELVRLREQLRQDLLRARHRVTKLLLRHRRVWESNAAAGIAAASPNGQIVLPMMLPLIFKIRSKSSACPRPCSRRRKIFSIQWQPSRHGLHGPHDS